MDIVLIIGRVLFALLFISSGVSHLTKLEAMTGYAQYKKVPAAKFSVVLSGLMILVGGLYIAFGVYADLGALLIALFLIPTSFLMHAFWKETGAMRPSAGISAAGGLLTRRPMPVPVGASAKFPALGSVNCLVSASTRAVFSRWRACSSRRHPNSSTACR